jgi:hypothetical protein
VVRKHDEQ